MLRILGQAANIIDEIKASPTNEIASPIQNQNQLCQSISLNINSNLKAKWQAPYLTKLIEQSSKTCSKAASSEAEGEYTLDAYLKDWLEESQYIEALLSLPNFAKEGLAVIVDAGISPSEIDQLIFNLDVDQVIDLLTYINILDDHGWPRETWDAYFSDTTLLSQAKRRRLGAIGEIQANAMLVLEFRNTPELNTAILRPSGIVAFLPELYQLMTEHDRSDGLLGTEFDGVIYWNNQRIIFESKTITSNRGLKTRFMRSKYAHQIKLFALASIQENLNALVYELKTPGRVVQDDFIDFMLEALDSGVELADGRRVVLPWEWRVIDASGLRIFRSEQAKLQFVMADDNLANQAFKIPAARSMPLQVNGSGGQTTVLVSEIDEVPSPAERKTLRYHQVLRQIRQNVAAIMRELIDVEARIDARERFFRQVRRSHFDPNRLIPIPSFLVTDGISISTREFREAYRNYQAEPSPARHDELVAAIDRIELVIRGRRSARIAQLNIELTRFQDSNAELLARLRPSEELIQAMLIDSIDIMTNESAEIVAGDAVTRVNALNLEGRRRLRGINDQALINNLLESVNFIHGDGLTDINLNPAEMANFKALITTWEAARLDSIPEHCYFAIYEEARRQGYSDLSERADIAMEILEHYYRNRYPTARVWLNENNLRNDIARYSLATLVERLKERTDADLQVIAINAELEYLNTVLSDPNYADLGESEKLDIALTLIEQRAAEATVLRFGLEHHASQQWSNLFTSSTLRVLNSNPRTRAIVDGLGNRRTAFALKANGAYLHAYAKPIRARPGPVRLPGR